MPETNNKLPWYTLVFGGKKAFLGILCLGAGIGIWFSLATKAKAVNFIQMLVFILCCGGIYTYGNLKEKQIQNGNSK